MVAPRVSAVDASTRTVQDRAHSTTFHRSMISGGSDNVLLEHEVRALSQGERAELLSVFKEPVSLAAEDVLALKAGLMIPWHKLRAMRR